MSDSPLVSERPPAPGTKVLVAHPPTPADLEIAQTQGWYRIRSQEMAGRIRGGLEFFEYLAFYQPKAFRRERFCVRRYARLRNVTESRRIDLLPEEPGHPRAQQLYLKLELGPIQLLERPVLSSRPRRILFVPTTWRKLHEAEELNDLFVGSRLEDRLYLKLRELGLLPEREWFVQYSDPRKTGRPARSFFLDFALFCQDRDLDIETDGDAWHLGEKSSARDNERDNLLEANRWHILRFNTEHIERDIESTLSIIREAVNRFGGVLTPDSVLRRFGANGKLASGQKVFEF